MTTHRPNPRSTISTTSTTVASWLLTKDHKRIGLMYMVVVTIGVHHRRLLRRAASALELATPAGDLVSSDTYNRLFTMHGVMMVFFVLIPAVPAILGNFVLPLMLGAKDVAFPKINLISWYVFVHRAACSRSRAMVDRRRRHRLDVLSALQHRRLELATCCWPASASSSPASRRSSPASTSW